MNKLAKKFRDDLKATLGKEFELKNSFAVPKLVKVVVSMGVKEGASDKGVIEKNKNLLEAITGQAVRICRAKKSIAAFGLVKGNPIGLSVTLRREKMYDFLEKLLGIVLPRLRDFHGVSLEGFDGRGNYNLGISEIIVFPEIDYSKLEKVKGLQISLVTNAKDDKIAKRLLEVLGMPFAKPDLAQGKPEKELS